MKLHSWLDKNLYDLKYMEIGYEGLGPLEIPYIIRLTIAAALNKNGSDCVFVIPQAEILAQLTSIFSALYNTKQNFLSWRDEFAKKGLKPGQKVRLIPNNTIYEYSARFLEADGKKFLRLNLLGSKNSGGSTSLPLEEILRLFPTSRTQPIGRGNTTAKVDLSDLDKVLEIQSYGNYSLFKNRIILHGSKVEMDSFLEIWSIHRRDESGCIVANLKDMREIPWGWINREGKLQSFNRFQTYGEPVIAFSSRLSTIDEYCESQEQNSRTIITANKKAVLNNTFETQNLCRRQKVFLFTEEIDQVEANELKESGFSVWQFKREEILTGIHSEDGLDGFKDFIPLRKMYGAAGGDRSAIKIHKAESSILERIECNIIEAGKNIQDHEINNLTVQSLKRIYWRSLELLGIPDEIYQDWLLNQVLLVENVLQRQASFLGTDNIMKVRSIMEDMTVDLLPNIASHSQNKLAEIQNLQRTYSGHKMLLLCRHAEALEALKKRLDVFPGTTFLTYGEISIATKVYDIAVMVGWPGKHLFEKLFNSGITDKIEAVLYHNEISALNSYFHQKANTEEAIRLTIEQKAEIVGCPKELFNDSKPEDAAETMQIEHEETGLQGIEPKERTAIFNVDWSKRPKFSYLSSQQREQAIDAVYVSFNNDRCAYLTKSHRLPVIDPHTYQYRNKIVDELTAGDIVVFRRSGDREILRDIAKRLYPESYENLVVQAAEWKKWLNTLGTDTSDIWLNLSLNGLQRNFMTITNWVKNEDLIGPKDLRDIQIIAEATGCEEHIEKAPLIANAVKELRGIHVEAGFKLTKLLMSRLSEELNEDCQDHENLDTSLADVELMTVEEVDTEPVKIMPTFANEPHPIWWFDELGNIPLDGSD